MLRRFRGQQKTWTCMRGEGTGHEHLTRAQCLLLATVVMAIAQTVSASGKDLPQARSTEEQ